MKDPIFLSAEMKSAGIVAALYMKQKGIDHETIETITGNSKKDVDKIVAVDLDASFVESST